ncbi:hypothetical protein F4821DRAFT_260357 [Hypoxylon rubiginosum]|uniref:Uncharacterized protein n=1 Tax=Hypoxylon rubiginosum TaxID=110542 RepID=A0ACC0D0L6_9PEZI|nr:hypothetical protein F4821DRAFT_260357 [Hypoxylon rubiginosum]
MPPRRNRSMMYIVMHETSREHGVFVARTANFDNARQVPGSCSPSTAFVLSVSLSLTARLEQAQEVSPQPDQQHRGKGWLGTLGWTQDRMGIESSSGAMHVRREFVKKQPERRRSGGNDSSGPRSQRAFQGDGPVDVHKFTKWNEDFFNTAILVDVWKLEETGTLVHTETKAVNSTPARLRDGSNIRWNRLVPVFYMGLE